MIPQFAGQAAMLVPFALLCRWKYDQPLLPALRLGVRVRDAVRSFPAGLLLAVSVLALRGFASSSRYSIPDAGSDERSGVGAVGRCLRCVDWSRVRGDLLSRVVAAGRGTNRRCRWRDSDRRQFRFALLHGPQYAWSWRHVLLIAVAGSAFGWWRVTHGSTGASALMHAGYNAVLVAGYLIGRDAL